MAILVAKNPARAEPGRVVRRRPQKRAPTQRRVRDDRHAEGRCDRKHVALGTAVAAVFMRMTRSSLLEVMRQDYIRTARAKGLPERGVLWGHALKNSLIPLITVVGVQVGYLLGGAVVTEEVFTLPGVGRLLLWAVFQRDYPLVQGTILVISGLFLLSNLVVDLVYAYLDPRIRYG